MEHPAFPEVTHHHEPAGGTKHIWKTFWILLILTVIELALGMLMYATDFGSGIVLGIKGIIVILTMAKAFYIVAVFMHLGDEIRNFIMTIVVPLLLFVWFIGAFLWDGSSYRANRNRYDRKTNESTIGAPKHAADTSTQPLQ
jgi:cytochrome c oxidase subunit 4